MTREEYCRPFDPVVKAYAHWYGFAPRELWQTMTWRGVPALKTPSDLWIYQELLTKIRPGLIIEFGSNIGGTAVFLGDVLTLLDVPKAKVLTIDVKDYEGRTPHRRVIYLQGNPATEEAVMDIVSLAVTHSQGPVLIIEDADHTYETSAKLLELYSPLVTPGSYYVVEDTGLGYYDDEPLPGVARAVLEFVNTHPEFSVDWECERFGHTIAHGGFLRRAT